MATAVGSFFIPNSSIIPNVKRREEDIALLHDVCRYGKLDILRTLIERTVGFIDPHQAKNHRDRTLLHSAAMTGQLHVVKYLVEVVKVDVDAKDKFLRTPLHVACKLWQLGVVRYLIQNEDVNINCHDYVGYTPLHIAARDGQIYLLKLLLEEEYPAAIRLGSQKIAQTLAPNRTIDPFAVDTRGNTPLHIVPDIMTAQCILKSCRPSSAISELLCVRNSNGLNPLKVCRDTAEKMSNGRRRRAKEELIDYLVAFESQPLFAYNDDDDPSLSESKEKTTFTEVIANPRFNEFQRRFALKIRRLLLATDIQQVAHVVMGYLSLKDIMNF